MEESATLPFRIQHARDVGEKIVLDSECQLGGVWLPTDVSGPANETRQEVVRRAA